MDSSQGMTVNRGLVLHSSCIQIRYIFSNLRSFMWRIFAFKFRAPVQLCGHKYSINWTKGTSLGIQICCICEWGLDFAMSFDMWYEPSHQSTCNFWIHIFIFFIFFCLWCSMTLESNEGTPVEIFLLLLRKS
jgi:hypothetical protein